MSLDDFNTKLDVDMPPDGQLSDLFASMDQGGGKGMGGAEAVARIGTAAAGAAALAGGITGIFSAIYQGRMAQTQAKAVADRERFNREYARILEQDMYRDLAKTEQQIMERTGQYVGAVRSSAAAQNIQANYGSAAEFQVAARVQGELDVLEARNNVARSAFGMRTQANASAGREAFARISADNQRAQGILQAAGTMSLSASKGVRNILKGVL